MTSNITLTTLSFNDLKTLQEAYGSVATQAVEGEALDDCCCCCCSAASTSEPLSSE